MRRFGFPGLVLVTAAVWTAPVAAQTGPAQGPATLAAPALPGNTVSCVYDYMGAEDREMALLLIAREIVDGGRFGKTSPNVMAVDRLIDEAQDKCLDRFNWSIGRSESASGFALTAILAEALGQALDSFGLPITPLQNYFRENSTGLTGRISLNLADRIKLRGYLKEKGWDKAREADFGLGNLYLETLMLQSEAAGRFARTSGTARQVSRRQPAPARKASRGKP
jgi:hypothetical protein